MASQATSTGFSLSAIANRDALRDRYLLLHASIFVAAFFILALRRPDAVPGALRLAAAGPAGIG